MNASHSKLTDWGLAHASIEEHDTILDVGCGGGKTISKLAGAASRGKIYGVDFSGASVTASRRTNAQAIRLGRVEILHGSVSHLPLADEMFDLVTAVETHFWWPDLQEDMREIFRVLKPGGQLTIIAEVYKGATTGASRLAEKYADRIGMRLLSAEEHRQLFANVGYAQVRVIEENNKGWICAIGKKPSVRGGRPVE
jgi:ubiquinone/menaquinone biosynthesis C-methylase UbiE